MAAARMSWRGTLALAVVMGGAIAATSTVPVAGVQRRNLELQIRENRDRLEEIRRERESLQADLDALQGRARSITSELQNLDKQRTATVRLVRELDRQISGLTTQLDTISFEMILAEDAMEEKDAVLEQRIAEIYKRGPLWGFQVLLAAESFGDLLSRYKYLYLVSRQDRQIVQDIRALRDQVAEQRADLVNLRNEVAVQRRERDSELQEYASLERQRVRALEAMRASESRTSNRLDSLARDEERINEAIAALERARRASGDVVAPSISSVDMGTLPWPVEGEVIYRVGVEGFRDRTRLSNQGIGIRVPPGTPVRVVRSGRVVSTSAYGTYGPSVWVSHGDGFYTLYLYLSRVAVRLNQQVAEGDIIGLSGGENSDHGPHLEFQLRQTPPNAETPIPLDPLDWLRPRGR